MTERYIRTPKSWKELNDENTQLYAKIELLGYILGEDGDLVDNAQRLRAELDEARKVIEAAERIENGSCPFCGALLDHTKDCPLDKWLQAHPERK